MHTLLVTCGAYIPSFIHISDGKLHDVHALDMLLPEAGAIYVVDRGYVDFAGLYVLHQAGAFDRHACQVEHRLIASIRRRRIARPASSRPDHLPGRLYTRQDYPELPRSAHPLQGPRVRQDAGRRSSTPSRFRPVPSEARSTKAAGRWNCFGKWIEAASSDQAVLRHVGERGEDADLDCRHILGLRPCDQELEKMKNEMGTGLGCDTALGSVIRDFERLMQSSTCGSSPKFFDTTPPSQIRSNGIGSASPSF